MKTLYLLHHSHTDIGYTETQQRIESWHVDFIRQALTILRDEDSARGGLATPTAGGDTPPDFRWVCETFWAVERFFDRATEGEKHSFLTAVREERIGLSASYLNFNELIDDEVLRGVIARAARFRDRYEVPLTAAMTADINGHGWGFSQALFDHGFENLFACVHTHHGRYPLDRPQVPFWWETPRGEQVLVWSGEHYHFGNELGVAPGAVSSYLTKDECDADMIYHDPWGVAEIRIPRYFDRLQSEGYPYDFAPVMVSGLRTDNGPPNRAILEFAHRWNERHGDRIRVEMSTLDRFFARLRARPEDIPTHRGDWPDWWSDGPASDPESTRIFRQAQRDLRQLRRLRRRYGQQESDERIEHDLALYAEHTFAHADAMSQPWHFSNQVIAARKRAFAVTAHEQVQRARDALMSRIGTTTLRAGRPLRFLVVNPRDEPMRSMARLFIGHYEYHERNLEGPVRVHDVTSGLDLSFVREMGPGGCDFCVRVDLEPGEERTLELQPRPDEEPTGTESAPEWTLQGGVETPFVRIRWSRGDGITEWIDCVDGVDLLRPNRTHPPFSPVYELTPVDTVEKICAVRGRMVLNRKGENVQQHAGRLKRGRILEANSLFTRFELEYEVPGTRHCRLELRAHADEPRVDVTLRMHKKSRWEPENLYLSLPFCAGRTAGQDTGQLWLDKTGAAVRPRIDQLPGTLTDFYSLQEGMAWVGPSFAVALAIRDHALVQLGPLAHGERLLMGDPRLAEDPAHVYAWLMTNYWETNFAASLGGFHEFRYHLAWGRDLGQAEDALAVCAALNEEPICIRQEDVPEAFDPTVDPRTGSG